jgi:hypothetical protein
MRVVEGIISDALGPITDFSNKILPWMWENKMWLIALIPVIAVIAIAKYIHD